MSKRVFIERHACMVWISIDERGSLLLTGQDLDPGTLGVDEYEYFITVSPEHFDAIRAALDAPPDSDVIDVMCANAEKIFLTGETTWLKEHGIPYGFSNYF